MPVSQARQLRSDIQALRTIAVGLVVLFHLWPSQLSGGFIGVDVFFVISGFLITSHILRDVDKDQFSVFKFWVRRIRRLLPASLLVLAVTAISVILFVPISMWKQWLTEVQASVLYVQNWKLAGDSIDYLALGNSASPTQHFWSLSVEEQFYFVWPILVLLALLFSRAGEARLRRRAIFVVLATLSVGSLGYGIYLTAAEPAIAYFSTPVRAWEFGAGALIAFAPALKHRYPAVAVAMFGILLITVSGLTFTNTLAFPGALALLPVVGAVLVIWASVNDGWLGGLFRFKPLQWIGDHSYSIYLWHWPLIILLPYALKAEADPTQKLLVLALTLLLAWATTKFVERPLLSAKLWPAIRPRVVFAGMVVVGLALISPLHFEIKTATKLIAAEVQRVESISIERTECFGAAARAPGLEPCPNTQPAGLFPSIIAAQIDSGTSSKLCGNVNRDVSVPKDCKLTEGSQAVKIALVGDSHARHYSGAMQLVGERNNLEVHAFSKGGCPFSYAQRVNDEVLTNSCRGWVEATKEIILSGGYSAIVTSQRSEVDWVPQPEQTASQYAVAGVRKLWQEFVAAGISVLVIKDNPKNLPELMKCLAINQVSDCNQPRSAAFGFDPQVAAVNEMDHDFVTLLNFDEIYCDPVQCFAVIGNVIVYRGDDHLTNTFAKTLAPFIEPQLKKVLAAR